MKNPIWQNPGQLFVAQVLYLTFNKLSCEFKDYDKMQVLAKTYSTYTVLTTIALIIVITWIIIRYCSKKSSLIMVLSVGMGVTFILTLAVVFLEASYTFRIIRVEDDFNVTIFQVIGEGSDSLFKNGNNVKIEYGKTYIDNRSNKDIIIEPVIYSNSEFLFEHPGNDKDTVCQRMLSNSVAECKVSPDYYFLAPNSIMVERKKGSSGPIQKTIWVLRYSNYND